MKAIIITKTSMNSGNVVSFQEFTSEKKAINTFNEMKDELNYDNETIEENSLIKKIEIGGRGHDFRVELEITKA